MELLDEPTIQNLTTAIVESGRSSEMAVCIVDQVNQTIADMAQSKYEDLVRTESFEDWLKTIVSYAELRCFMQGNVSAAYIVFLLVLLALQCVYIVVRRWPCTRTRSPSVSVRLWWFLVISSSLLINSHISFRDLLSTSRSRRSPSQLPQTKKTPSGRLTNKQQHQNRFMRKSSADPQQ